MRERGELGAGSVITHWKTRQACRLGLCLVWLRGALTMCCTQRCLPDQGSHTLFWSLPSLLPLQPIEGFVPLKSKFLTF